VFGRKRGEALQIVDPALDRDETRTIERAGPFTIAAATAGVAGRVSRPVFEAAQSRPPS